MKQQITLKVTGMHCGGCSANVEKALKGVKGVSSAKVDLVANKATVEYDPAVANQKMLTEAVKKAGYTAA
jgi:P-type Cu+ transporter